MSHACHDHSRSARPVRRIGRIAGLLIAAAAVGCFPGCEPGDEQGTQPPSRPPARVTTASAISRDVPIYLERIGRIMALEVVAIVPQVRGKLIAAHVRDGADVRKNDLLFEIDPRPFEAELASAQARLAQDKALLELARAELARFESAVAMNAVSKLEYDQRKNAVAIAEARTAASEASVQTARLNLEYTRILSPIDGRAGALLIHPGNVVEENDAPLLMIQRLDPIYAEFTITENDLGTVRELMVAMEPGPDRSSGHGLRVEVDIPDDLTRVLPAPADANPTTRRSGNGAGPREGTLVFLDNTVQSQTGTTKLRAILPNSDHHFWPGQFVNVRLVLTVKEDAVLIPAEARQIGQQGAYVYVVTADETAEIRTIVPGQRQDAMLVVEQGLRPGEKVITSGHMSVRPGDKVRQDETDAGDNRTEAHRSTTAPANRRS